MDVWSIRGPLWCVRTEKTMKTSVVKYKNKESCPRGRGRNLTGHRHCFGRCCWASVYFYLLSSSQAHIFTPWPHNEPEISDGDPWNDVLLVCCGDCIRLSAPPLCLPARRGCSAATVEVKLILKALFAVICPSIHTKPLQKMCPRSPKYWHTAISI